MWTCGTCGEEQEDTFEACWKCQSARDGTIPLPQQPEEDYLSFDMLIAKESLEDQQEQERLIETARDAAYREAYRAIKGTGISQCDICGNSFKINELVGRAWLLAVYEKKEDLVEQEGTFQTWRTTSSTTPIEPTIPISVWFCKECFWSRFHKETTRIDRRLILTLSLFILLFPLVLIGTRAFYYFLVINPLIALFLIVLTLKTNPRRRLRKFYKYYKKRAVNENARFYLIDVLDLLSKSFSGRFGDKLKTFAKEHLGEEHDTLVKSYTGIPVREDDNVPTWLMDELKDTTSESLQ